MKVPKLASSIRITVLYIVLGTTWIVTTDRLSTWLIPLNPTLYLHLQTTKGWLFVIASALFFFFMQRAEERRRQSIQRTLEESERRYRSLFTDSPTPLWEEDFSATKICLDQLHAQGVEDFMTYFTEHPEVAQQVIRSVKVLDVNAAACRLYEASREELLGGLQNLFGKEGLISFTHELTMIAQGYRQFDMEVTVTTLRGEARHTIIHWLAAPGFEQTLQRVYVNITDITERKRLENEHKVLLERLNLILEHSPIACIMYDKSYLINYWNPAAERIFGFKEEEVLGRSPFTLFVPSEVASYVHALLERLATNPGSVQGVNANITKDGRRIICEWSNTPLMDNQGNFIGHLAMAQDVTERTRVIEVLQESEQRFRRLVDSNIIGVVIYDTDGTVLEANEAFLRMTGYEYSDLPLDWFTLTPPEQRPLEEQTLHEINSLGASQPVEREIRRKDGMQIPVLIGATRLDEPTQLITFVLDLSETKRKEAQIRASLAEKEILLREVHHRVKNNLEVIISLAELQTIKISDPATLNSIRELQERIRSIALVHENLYRSENLEQIHIQTYLEKLISFLIVSFASAEYDIQIDAGDVVMDIAHAIPTGLIVNELVTNAFKHAFPAKRQQKSITPEQQITIRLSEEQQQYILEVWDNGVGLPADLDLQNARSLGLRLVNLLSLQMHGQVQATTNAGAHFKITFPGHS